MEVHRLRLNNMGIQTHLRAEHFKKCMREEYTEEGTSIPPNSEIWMKLVDLTQYM